MRDILPNEVIEAIKGHLSGRAKDVQADVWESSNQDEDSLTGDFFGNLRERGRLQVVGNQQYSWSVTYKKIRGRGPSAPEKPTGSDGIFEVEVEDKATGEIHRKALPFQAKKRWDACDSKLLEQVSKMEALTEGASGVIDYSPDGFTAVDGRDVVVSRGHPTANRLSAGDFLGRVVECKSGSRHVFYDAARGLLLVKARAIRVPIDHRLRVSVEIR